MAAGLTPSEFAAKWKGSTRTERAAAQEHFIDLCRMLGVPTPNDADPTGEWYAFEKGAEKLGGGDGFADVWKRDHFAWEYKGKRKDLTAAYRQLLEYREALQNPPLLVVCDLARFEVHTNFTGTAKRVHTFTLDDLAKSPQEPLRVLRAVMGDPSALKPSLTRNQLTEEAAHKFAGLAQGLRDRKHDPQRVAHFLNKLLFCMFAEDVGLLPKGLVGRLCDSAGRAPEDFADALRTLFGRMAKDGGLFGVDRIEWFNGGLFDGDDVLPFTREEILVVREVAQLDWSEVEPAIFGTLFERFLDPENRTALGAHYTDRVSIERVVGPVVMEPLRGEFEALRSAIRDLRLSEKKGGALTKGRNQAERLVTAFLDRLASVRVLDPACGSGNFLYVALQHLKELEHEARLWASTELGVPMRLPQVGPEAVRGIELNIYAAELARVTIWIGEIQWMIGHGLGNRNNPILQPLENIECRDALLDRQDSAHPAEAKWPEAEFIIGNPPFLGGKLMRRNLGEGYVDALFSVFDGRVPREADFVTYWFEKSREAIAEKRTKRAGLLGTQGIRGGASRQVLERIQGTGGIFMAWSDEEWVLDGAAVHVSIVGFDGGSEKRRMLDGVEVPAINANLRSGADVTRARRLKENLDTAFMGDTKGGAFDIPEELAKQMLAAPNPHGRPNAEVVRPWVNSLDITRRPRRMWIVDFGTEMVERDAVLYEAPWAYVEGCVRGARAASRTTIESWWLHERPRGDMRRRLARLPRYLVTPTLAKHRLFAWLDSSTLPDHQLIVIARDDDLAMGVLHSRVHEAWARGQGTQLREVESGFRYTPTTTFETFPFPRPAPAQRAAIEREAADLDRLRQGWLNPPGADAATLKKRTLTNLYNERPAWLAQVHARLDAVVLDAYGWPPDIGDEDLLARLLALNLEREPAEGEARHEGRG